MRGTLHAEVSDELLFMVSAVDLLELGHRRLLLILSINYSKKVIMGPSPRINHYFQRMEYDQEGGGADSVYVAGCILAVVVVLLIVLVSWCRGRNVEVMQQRA